MKAILCQEFGPASNLKLVELADPVPGPGEVLVDVEAVALNFFDTLIIRDRYQLKPPLPFSPGGEMAGTVAAVGPDCAIAVGTRVVAYTKFGAARQKLVLPEDEVMPVPDGVPAEIAASLPIAYGTTLHALKDRADLQPGETLAILGASGGVGQAAIEIGKLMGARVIACASSDDKLAFCRDMGADATVNYETEDLKTRLRELTDGVGVDVIYDAVGDRFSEPALRACAWGGRHLVIGFAAGEIPKLPLNLLLLKGCDLRGVFWGEHVVREPELFAENMAQLLDWIATGALKPHVHAVYPMAEFATALDDIASRRAKGKVVVRIEHD